MINLEKKPKRYMVYEKKIDGSVVEFGRRDNITDAMATIKAMTRLVNGKNSVIKDVLYYYCLPIKEEEV